MLETCLIGLLANGNRTYRHDRAKYITVRNCSIVDEDKAAKNRFDRVDLLYEDVNFNREQIELLNESIHDKYEKMMDIRRRRK